VFSLAVGIGVRLGKYSCQISLVFSLAVGNDLQIAVSYIHLSSHMCMMM